MKLKTYTLFLAVLLSLPNYSQQIEKCYNGAALSKRLAVSHSSSYSLNDFYSKQINSGEFDNNKDDNGNSGFYFPAKSKKGVAFSCGLIWIGKQNNTLKASGNIYSRSTLTPGKILPDGKPDDPLAEKYRVYRVKANYRTSAFENEIANGEGTYQQIYVGYEKDWNEWPASSGAPFNDVNKNGVYEPSIDIPGVPGSHQTLWFVTNDLKKVNSTFFGTVNDFGIETQVTIWGYETESPVKNTIFRKYKLINKSSVDIKEMYTGIFSDATANASTKSYAGCDSTLGLGYAYYSEQTDFLYGVNPPALGFKYLQGPMVDGSSSDYVFKNGKKISGKKNLAATSFVFYTCGGNEIPWPSSTSTSWYKNLQGIDNNTGKVFEIPTSYGGGKTKFVYSGDPVKKLGWIDGVTQSCGQRYLLLGSGPFNLAALDTQEIVFAEIVGVGPNNLDAITSLKDRAVQSQKIFDSSIAYNSLYVPTLTQFNPAGVEVTNDQNSITIKWDKDPNEVKRIETLSENGYTFQGYNVYQLSSDLPVKDAGKLISTFDVVDGIKNVKEIYYKADGTTEERVEQFGSDYGAAYSFKVSKDFLTNSEFVKGKTYSFAVSAYYVSKDVNNGNTQSIIIRKSYETPLTVLSIQYRKDEAGINFKDQLVVQSKLSYTKDNCKVYVTNPLQLTNHDYQINFKLVNDILLWNLLDKTLSKEILSNQNLVEENYYYYLDSWMPQADGLQFLLIKPTKGIRNNNLGIVEVAYGGKELTSNEYDEKGKEFLGNHVWNDPNYPGLSNERDKYFLKSNLSLLNVSNADYYDYEIRFTNEGSYALTLDKKIIQIPFEFWNVGVNTFNDNKDDFKLIPTMLDPYSAGMTYWASMIESVTNPKTSPRTKALKIINKNSATADYDAFKNACLQSGGIGSTFNLNYDNGVVKQNLTEFSNFVFVDADKDGNPPPAGTVVRIITKKGLSVNDLFEFNQNNFTDVAQQNIPAEFSLSQNYPNPFNPETTINYTIPPNVKGETINVTLKVYDVLGREIAELVNGFKQPGNYKVKFNVEARHQPRRDRVSTGGASLPSGVYFYRLQFGSNALTKKLVLLK